MLAYSIVILVFCIILLALATIDDLTSSVVLILIVFIIIIMSLLLGRCLTSRKILDDLYKSEKIYYTIDENKNKIIEVADSTLTEIIYYLDKVK